MRPPAEVKTPSLGAATDTEAKATPEIRAEKEPAEKKPAKKPAAKARKKTSE